MISENIIISFVCWNMVCIICLVLK